MSGFRTFPGQNAVTVTPHDSNNLATPSRAIYLGVAGDVKVTMLGGMDVTFKAMTAGVLHPIQVTRIWNTGTGAADILAVC